MIVELLITAFIQSPPASRRSHLVFTHDGANTTKYQACVDTLPCVDLIPGTKPPTSPLTERWMAFPSITPGEHTATVLACNPDICSDPSDATTFRFVVIPNSPTDIRIEIK